jgi:dUTP pyrophosphatase
LRINVFVETDDPDLIPKRQTEGSSGYDLHSNIDTTLQPDECKVIPTGIKLSIPLGYEGQVRSRSGLAAKHMIQVLNSGL